MAEADQLILNSSVAPAGRPAHQSARAGRWEVTGGNRSGEGAPFVPCAARGRPRRAVNPGPDAGVSGRGLGELGDAAAGDQRVDLARGEPMPDRDV